MLRRTPDSNAGSYRRERDDAQYLHLRVPQLQNSKGKLPRSICPADGVVAKREARAGLGRHFFPNRKSLSYLACEHTMRAAALDKRLKR